MWVITPGFSKIIEMLCIARYFESPYPDHHIAVNAYSIDYTNSWSSKRILSQSTSHSTHRNTIQYWFEHIVDFDTGVLWERLPIPRIHRWVAQEFKIQRFPAALHNTGQMYHPQLCHGYFMAILVLDTVHVEEAYSDSSSDYHRVQWHSIILMSLCEL